MLAGGPIKSARISEPSQVITRVIMHSLTLPAVFSKARFLPAELEHADAHEAGRKAEAISLLGTKHIFSMLEKNSAHPNRIIENFKVTLNGLKSVCILVVWLFYTKNFMFHVYLPKYAKKDKNFLCETLPLQVINAELKGEMRKYLIMSLLVTCTSLV